MAAAATLRGFFPHNNIIANFVTNCNMMSTARLNAILDKIADRSERLESELERERQKNLELEKTVSELLLLLLESDENILKYKKVILSSVALAKQINGST